MTRKNQGSIWRLVWVTIFIAGASSAYLSVGANCSGGGDTTADITRQPQPGVVYFLDDHLGNTHLVTDSTGKVFHEESRYPYGVKKYDRNMADNSEAVSESKPYYSYTGKEYDEETGLVYFGGRYYAPELGRWITPDPTYVGPVGEYIERMYDPGQRTPIQTRLIKNPLEHNLYGYVRSNPATRIDPSGLTSLSFLRKEGNLVVDPETEGRSPYTIPATSGQGGCMNNPACENIPDVGPIPKGNYIGNSAELSDPNFVGDILRNFATDWGDWRMPLTSSDETNTQNRDGFFLHGGSKAGTKGCIDIGGGTFGNKQTDTLRNDILQDPDGKIPMSVE